MNWIRVGEWPGFCYQEIYEPNKKIDRTNKTVADLLDELKLHWTFDLDQSDFWIRKTELSLPNEACRQDELARIQKCKTKPHLLLIAEPREHAPLTYEYADPTRTMAVGPGTEFEMLYDKREWQDPELENWSKRQDRLCWIGRPTSDRIALAKKLYEQNIPLDIYSREPWPLPCWKGGAPDDVKIAKTYKYRMVFETTQTHLLHSEKLFVSLLSGCVSFYHCDPKLDLEFNRGTYIRWSFDNFKNRAALAPAVLEKMNKFLFSNAWEVYSYGEYFRRLSKNIRRLMEGPGSTSPLPNIRNPKPQIWVSEFESGYSALEKRNPAAALPHFEKCSEILGPITQILLNIGYSHMELGQSEKAQQKFIEAALREPENRDVKVNMGVNFIRQNKISEAKKIFTELVKVYPDYELAKRNLEVCLQKERN